MELIAFYVFAAIAVIASLLVVGLRSPMHSVMLLIVSFGALAGLYVLLDAPFTAVTQIIIYAGAIMVLFLFVVMLLNAQGEEELPRPRVPTRSSSSWSGRSCASARPASARISRRLRRSARSRGLAALCSPRTRSRSR
jgi:NADH:ubiquinone oxidoreductase subunit 6 (subunit J)